MIANQLRELIHEVLDPMGIGGDDACELLIMTCAAETNMGQAIKQIKGPALGIFQMEPATHHDLYNWAIGHNKWTDVIDEFRSENGYGTALKSNLAYAIFMSRLYYLRVPEKLPVLETFVNGKYKEITKESATKFAEYWKKYYNTVKGAGTVQGALNAYQQYRYKMEV